MKGLDKLGKIILASKSPSLYTYEIINTYPHDIEAYTQGLEFDDEILYESTGLNGKSSLRKIDYLKGKVLNSINLNESFFFSSSLYFFYFRT